MNKFRNYFNKVIVGAGIVGALSLNGCMESTQSADAKETVKTEGLVSITSDSTNTAKSANAQGISLEPQKTVWNNTKLVGKDYGFIGYSRYGGDGEIGLTHVYGRYLFKNPEGEEIILFGREWPMFVGQNYNIEFYRTNPDQEISSSSILEALGVPKDKYNKIQPEIVDPMVGRDLEGLLNDYTRVKK